MTYTELIEQNVPCGGYLFYGDEDYLKNHTLEKVRQVLFPEAGMMDFNRYLFTAENYTPADVAEAMLAPAMMTDKKLIEIHLPEGDKLKEKDRSALTDALAGLKEAPDTVLVLVFPAEAIDPGTPKRPAPLFRSLIKHLTPIEFPLQPDAKLLKWMARHLAGYGVSLLPSVGQQILACCGRSMMRLSGELAKAGAYAAAHGMTELTMEVVGQVITTTPEDDAFRLANCLLEGNKAAAYETLSQKIRKKEEPILLLAQITRVYMDLAAAAVFREEGRDKRDYAASLKMHEYKAGLYYKAASAYPAAWFTDALDKCLETDYAMKTSGGDGYQLLERLVGVL